MSDYNWLEETYGGEVTYRENSGLRAYSFTAAGDNTFTPKRAALGYLVPMAVHYLRNGTEDDGQLSTTLNQTLLDAANSQYGVDPWILYRSAKSYWLDHFAHRVGGTTLERYFPRNRADGPIGQLLFGPECADERTPPKDFEETDFN